MPTKNNPIQPASDREFAISRTFDAPRDLVFRAWTDARHMSKWWGPRLFTNPVCEMDAKVGGAYRIVMRGPEGSEYPLSGVFLKIEAPTLLVMTMDVSGHPKDWHDQVRPGPGAEAGNPAGEMVMTVRFEEQGGKTRVDVRILFESASALASMVDMGMNEGWTQSLDRLGAALDGTTDREILTTRVYDAARETVFRAWTDPRHIAKWWGPNGFRTTIHRMDVKPGGIWRLTMHGPDGTDHESDLVYVEVTAPSRLVIDHVSTPKFRFTVTFEDEAGRTRITMRQLFETASLPYLTEHRNSAVEGARQTLARLADHLPT